MHNTTVTRVAHIGQFVDDPGVRVQRQRTAGDIVAVVALRLPAVGPRRGSACVLELVGRGMTRAVTEEVSVSPVDPYREAARPGRGNQIEVPVAVEVDRGDLDDGRVRLQVPLTVPGREPDDDFRRPNSGFHPVVNAVAVEVGQQRLGRCRRRDGHDGDREGEESDGAARNAAHAVNYTVPIPSCHEFIEMKA